MTDAAEIEPKDHDPARHDFPASIIRLPALIYDCEAC
jgi:hypothetical protein